MEIWNSCCLAVKLHHLVIEMFFPKIKFVQVTKKQSDPVFSTGCILIQPGPGGYFLWSLAQRPDKLKKSPTVILLRKRDREREKKTPNNGDCETLSVFTFSLFNSVKVICGVFHPQCSACV